MRNTCDDANSEEGTDISDLETAFVAAAEDAKQLPERPDNAQLLRLYAFFKQGSSGDVTGDRPGMMAFVDRAKYDAWAELQGMSQHDAKQAYIDLVDELKGS